MKFSETLTKQDLVGMLFVVIIFFSLTSCSFSDDGSSANDNTPDILKPVESDSKLIRAKALLPQLESCPNGDEATKKAQKEIEYYRGAAHEAIDFYINYKIQVAGNEGLTKKAWAEVSVVDESWASNKVGYNIDKIVEHRVEGLGNACKIVLER